VAQPSTNRFDFLRLLFASLVFVFHLVVLANLADGTKLENNLAHLAELSIQGFFIISGALVYGSLLNSDGLRDYFDKRFRRLYPAYFVVILIPAIASLLLSGQSTGVLRYLASNSVFLNFLEPNLPGLFDGQRQTEVNGALWTLKIEVMFYALLPLLGWILAKFHKAKWGILASIYIGAEIWRANIGHFDIPIAKQLVHQLPGQMSFFVAGITLWIFRDKAEKFALVAIPIGLIILAVSYAQHLEVVRAVGLAVIVAGIAYSPGPKLNVARHGDISYGVYITHFPIINTFLAIGVFAYNPWAGVIASTIAIAVSSMLLWKFVERPFLKRSSHYRQVEGKD